MKNFKKLSFKFLLVAVVTSSLFGCSKFDDYDEPVFTLQCYQYEEDPETVEVYFSTTAKTIPEVTVNGEAITYWWLDDGDVQGGIRISADETIDYTVTDDGKTTSGTIDMPEFITEIECNNKTIEESKSLSDNIKQESSYDFEWNDADCDYQVFYCSYTNSILNVLLDPDESEYTIKERDLMDYYKDTYFYVYLSTVNGVRLSSGSSPNVEGKYGKGFVFGQCEGSFQIDLYTGYDSVEKAHSDNTTMKERNKARMEEFRLMLQGN